MTGQPAGDREMGARIARLRQQRGWTQEELRAHVAAEAQRQGLTRANTYSRAWLSKIERGESNLLARDVRILAGILDCSVAYLFGETTLSLPGWDRLTERDRQEVDALIRVKIALRDASSDPKNEVSGR